MDYRPKIDRRKENYEKRMERERQEVINKS